MVPFARLGSFRHTLIRLSRLYFTLASLLRFRESFPLWQPAQDIFCPAIAPPQKTFFPSLYISSRCGVARGGEYGPDAYRTADTANSRIAASVRGSITNFLSRS